MKESNYGNGRKCSGCNRGHIRNGTLLGCRAWKVRTGAYRRPQREAPEDTLNVLYTLGITAKGAKCDVADIESVKAFRQAALIWDRSEAW